MTPCLQPFDCNQVVEARCTACTWYSGTSGTKRSLISVLYPCTSVPTRIERGKQPLLLRVRAGAVHSLHAVQTFLNKGKEEVHKELDRTAGLYRSTRDLYPSGTARIVAGMARRRSARRSRSVNENQAKSKRYAAASSPIAAREFFIGVIVVCASRMTSRIAEPAFFGVCEARRAGFCTAEFNFSNPRGRGGRRAAVPGWLRDGVSRLSFWISYKYFNWLWIISASRVADGYRAGLQFRFCS